MFGLELGFLGVLALRNGFGAVTVGDLGAGAAGEDIEDHGLNAVADGHCEMEQAEPGRATEALELD